MGDPFDNIVFPSVRKRAQLIDQVSDPHHASSPSQPAMPSDFSGWVKFCPGSNSNKKPPPVPSKPLNLRPPDSPHNSTHFQSQDCTNLNSTSIVFTNQVDSAPRSPLKTSDLSPVSETHPPTSMSFGESQTFALDPCPKFPKGSLGKVFPNNPSETEINPFDDAHDAFSSPPIFSSPVQAFENLNLDGHPPSSQQQISPLGLTSIKSPFGTSPPTLQRPSQTEPNIQAQQFMLEEEALDIPLKDKKPLLPPKVLRDADFSTSHKNPSGDPPSRASMVSRSITVPKPNLPPKPTEKPILPPKPTQSSITHSRCISEGGEGVLPPRLPLKSRPLEKPFTDPLIDSMHPSRSPPSLGYAPISTKGCIRCMAVSGKVLLLGGHGLRGWDITTGDLILDLGSGPENRVTGVAFLPSRFLDDEGWYAWFGTSEGQLNVLDIAEGKTIDRRSSLHHQAVTHLLRYRNSLLTLDESGLLQVWPETSEDGRMLASMSFDWRPRMSKVSFTKGDLATVIGEELWMASNRTIVAVRALAATGSQSAVQDIDFSDGLITCMAASEGLGWVIVGHQDGKVTVWNSLERRRLGGVLLAPYRINSLLVVLDRYLWVAVTNKLLVYDLLPPRRGTGPTLWVLRKEFVAHDAPITHLAADPVGFLITSKYTIASACENGQVKFWDGLLAGDWQANRLEASRENYCLLREVRVRVCSWNIDASKPSDLLSSAINSKFLEPWLCPDPQEVPDLIVVGFQEIVDLESKKVTAKSIFRKKEDTGEHITQRYNRWQQRLVQAMSVAAPGCRYKLIECQNLVGLFSCIFIKESESSRVQGIEVSTTKTGFGGLHGNKGAIAVRFLWDDTSLCFVNCHLAAGQTQVSARNNDVSTILKKTILSPMNSSAAPLVPEALSRDQKNHLTAWETAPLFVGGGDGQQILDHEVCVFSGDLNYRIDLPRDKVEDLIRHKEWDQLQEYDQLFQLRRSKVPFMLRLFTEPRLCFAPTYKYDPYTTKYDTTDKRRCPAWCDRILYRGTSLKVMDYGRAECNVSDHRPIAASFTCLIKTVVLDKYQLACQEAAETWATRCRSHCMRNLNNHLVRLGYSPALIATAMELEGSDPIRVAHHLFKRVQDTVSLTYTPF